MRKSLFTLLLSASVLSPAMAGNFSLSVDGYDIATNVYSVQGEYFWGENSEFSVIAKPYLLDRSESGIDWSGYGLELAVRKYGANIENLFFQTGIDVGYIKAEKGSWSDDSVFLGFNAKAGYRYYIAGGLFADLGVGIGYYTSSVEYRDSDYRDLDGIELFGIVSLGYKF